MRQSNHGGQTGACRVAKHTTKEFKGYDIPTIIQCMEGNTEISTIPIHPGMKKKTSEAIDGMKEESAIPNEGTITLNQEQFSTVQE